MAGKPIPKSDREFNAARFARLAKADGFALIHRCWGSTMDIDAGHNGRVRQNPADAGAVVGLVKKGSKLVVEASAVGSAGTGHNWNDAQVLKTQKQNFKWFGWKTPAALSFNWQYTRNAAKESPESYLGAIEEFGALLQIGLPR